MVGTSLRRALERELMEYDARLESDPSHPSLEPLYMMHGENYPHTVETEYELAEEVYQASTPINGMRVHHNYKVPEQGNDTAGVEPSETLELRVDNPLESNLLQIQLYPREHGQYFIESVDSPSLKKPNNNIQTAYEALQGIKETTHSAETIVGYFMQAFGDPQTK